MNFSFNAVHFTAAQEAAIRCWFPKSADPLWNRVAILDLRQALDLPAIAYQAFLGPNCWLAGGSVMRWLCGEQTEGSSTKGDFDFYFPSLEALNTTAQAMVEQGFRLRGYGNPPRNIREFLRRSVREERDSGIWDDAGNLAPITPALIERLGLGTLELLSPEGKQVQLVALAFDATPLDTIKHFDFSICQLALDDRYLSFGHSTFSDLIGKRFRVECLRWPLNTCRRMFLYTRRGFWPYPGSAVKILSLACGRMAHYGIRSLLRRCQRSSAGG